MECPKCGSKTMADSAYCRRCGSELHPPGETPRREEDPTRRAGRELTSGSIFESRYQILEELGRGGMGVVYKAEDSKLRRHVALKFLPSDLTRNPEAKERFIHEAQAASALDHPNICTVYEIDETGDGQMYISMGCYEGETLDQMIEGGPLALEDATSIAIQVAQGLGEAHEKGIVHRDVKPSNIIVTTKGQAKIMDFGLAKLAGQTRLTKAGTTMGTVAYMSPEQAQGEDVDHRSDIWSLGAVLYEMVTGVQPFRGEYDQAVIYSILNEQPTSPTELCPGISPDLGGIIEKCLRKYPEDRYQNTSELEAAIGRFRRASELEPMTRALGTRGLPGLASRSGLKIGVPVAVIVVVAAVLAVVPSARRTIGRLIGIGGGEAAEMRVAVLPCDLVGGTREDRAFCDGMTGVLTQKLAELGSMSSRLWVVPSGEIQDLETKSPSEAYKQLGANVAVTGNMRLSNGDIRLVLIRNDLGGDSNQESSTQTWEERRLDPITDSFANLATWRDSIVVRVSRLLDLEVTPGQRLALFTGGTTVPLAYESYLKGRGYLYPYEGEEDIDAGTSMLEEAIREDSSFTEAYVELGRAFMWKLYDEPTEAWLNSAIQACDKALAIDDSCVDAHVVAGYSYHYAGHPDEALRRFDLALAMDSLAYKAHAGRGEVFQAQGEPERAERAFRRATELQPRKFRYHYDLGMIYLGLQRYDDALRQFEIMVELRPASYRVYTNLGAMYFFLERLPAAMEMFEKSLAIQPTYRAMQNLASIYYWEARYADAARMYDQALELNPKDYRIWGHLADSYYWSPGNKDEAEECFKKAIDLAVIELEQDPENVEVLSNLAGYHAMLGNTSEAEELLGRAVAGVPTGADEMLHIAETYEKLGHRTHALEWVEKALANGATALKVERYPGLRGLRADPRFRSLREESADESAT